jgi:hypothetical protein
MVKRKPPPDSQDALAQLKAKRANALDEVAKLDALIAAVETALGTEFAAPPKTPMNRGRPRKAKPNKSAVHSPYYGMGLGEAGKKMLSLVPDKTPRLLKDIWEAIHSSGYTITAKVPLSTLSWQLRKREERDRDVILIGDGKWALAEWYNPEKLDQIRATRGKQPWRNREDHIERTKAGLRQAAEARGVVLGAPRKVTDEMLVQIELMLNAQQDAGDIAKTLKIAKSSIYAYFRVARRNGRIVATRKGAEKASSPKADGSVGSTSTQPSLKLVEVA